MPLEKCPSCGSTELLVSSGGQDADGDIFDNYWCQGCDCEFTFYTGINEEKDGG